MSKINNFINKFFSRKQTKDTRYNPPSEINDNNIKNNIFNQILIFLSTPEGERAAKQALDSTYNNNGYKYFRNVYSDGSVSFSLRGESLETLKNQIFNTIKQNVSDINLIIEYNFYNNKEGQIKNFSYFSLDTPSHYSIGFQNLLYKVSIKSYIVFESGQKASIEFNVTPQGTSIFHIPREASNIQDALESIVYHIIYLSKPQRNKSGYKV